MSFTSEQVDKLKEFAEKNFAENALPLPIKFDELPKIFNAEMQKFLDKCPFEDAENIDIMEKLFLIKNFCHTVESEEGKFFINIFGDRTAIIGLCDAGSDRFKLLACIYTKPETKDENTLSSVVLDHFVKILLPGVETEKFLRELAYSVIKIQGGVKFSTAADDNLIFVTATAF